MRHKLSPQWISKGTRKSLVTHQAFPLLLDGVTVGVGLDAVNSTLASLLAMAKIFLCFWDSFAGTGECLMPVLTLQEKYAPSTIVRKV